MKPGTMSGQTTDPHEEFLQESKNGEWINAPAIQQPSNGQIWLRVTGLRIYLLVLVCATDGSSESDEVDRSSRASRSSVLHSSEESASSISYAAIFPYTYFYWESRKFVRKFDIQRSKMTVVDDYIHLLLAPFGNAVWTDEDLQSIQQSAESTRAPEVVEKTEDSTAEQNGRAHSNHAKEDAEGDAELAEVSEQPSEEKSVINMCTGRITPEVEPEPAASAPLILGQASTKGEVVPNSLSEPTAAASSDNINTSMPPEPLTVECELPGSTALSSSFVVLQSGVCGDQPGSQDAPVPIATSDAQTASTEKPSPPAIRQLFKSRIPVITWTRPKIVDKAVGKEETEEDTTMMMIPGAVTSSRSTKRHTSSRIPLLKHSISHHVDGDTGKSEGSCQIPPLPSDAHPRSPRHSRAAKCENADHEVCGYTGSSRPLRKPRKKADQMDEETRDQEERRHSRDATMTVRRRRTKYRTRTLETVDFSRELRGLDVIRSKLENMTDDQWNRVLAILSGNVGDWCAPSPPPPLPPPAPSKNSGVISPWPRRPRGISPACIERRVEHKESGPRSLIRKKDRKRRSAVEGSQRNQKEEDEEAEWQERKDDGIRSGREHTTYPLPPADLLLAQKPQPQAQHPVRRTREVHRRRERTETDLPNYFYRARTEMQVEKIFGKH
ncbi:hypothetical protein SprV_0301338400 [Sparganum proliferum]